jgi:hypothetical protein
MSSLTKVYESREYSKDDALRASFFGNNSQKMLRKEN